MNTNEAIRIYKEQIKTKDSHAMAFITALIDVAQKKENDGVFYALCNTLPGKYAKKYADRYSFTIISEYQLLLEDIHTGRGFEINPIPGLWEREDLKILTRFVRNEINAVLR